MLKLRTTACLSLLALATGMGGTLWLSGLTDDWQGPPASAHAHLGKVRALLRRHTQPVAAPHRNEHSSVAVQTAPSASTSAPSLPTLTPIDMPPASTPLFSRVAPATGLVVLRLAVDGAGQVTQASVAQSSGDSELDARALRTALRWRFAVPADHPDGLTGSLVMRFDGSTAAL